jgi:hypothetical protein
MTRVKDSVIALGDPQRHDAYIRLMPSGLRATELAMFIGMNGATMHVNLTVDEAAELSAMLEEVSTGIEERKEDNDN